MRASEKKENKSEPLSSNRARSSGEAQGLDARAAYVLGLQQTIGNRAVTQMVQRKAERTETLGFANDLRDIPVQQPTDEILQQANASLNSLHVASITHKSSLQLKPKDPEPSGDEPLDPFVTGWDKFMDAVLII